MHEISWVVVLLYSIPECFLVTWLGLQAINYTPSFYGLLIVSVIYGPFVYIIRRLPLPYGLPTVLLVAIVAFLICIILRIPLMKSTISIILGVAITLCLETITLPVVVYVLQIPLTEIVAAPVLSIMVSVPKLLVMVFLCLYLRRNNKYLFDLLGSA